MVIETVTEKALLLVFSGNIIEGRLPWSGLPWSVAWYTHSRNFTGNFMKGGLPWSSLPQRGTWCSKPTHFGSLGGNMFTAEQNTRNPLALDKMAAACL